MNIAYMLFVYNTPHHTAKLIRRLESQNAFFVVHVDSKYDLKPYQALESERVRFTKSRVPVYWGDYSQIEAMLLLLKESLALEPRCDRMVLLSGSDYPVRSRQDVEAFFQENPLSEFISLRKMPCPEVGKPLSRLNNYVIRPHLTPTVQRLCRVGQRVGLVPKVRDYRAHFGDIKAYGGSTWWSVSRSGAQQIVKFAADNPRVATYFRNTELPDESFCHTAIGNSDLLGNVTRNITYADWSGGGSNPAMLTSDHVERLLKDPNFPSSDPFGSGPILFARKFPDASDELTEMIDLATG